MSFYLSVSLTHHHHSIQWLISYLFIAILAISVTLPWAVYAADVQILETRARGTGITPFFSSVAEGQVHSQTFSNWQKDAQESHSGS
jgi:hypothetical protein